MQFELSYVEIQSNYVFNLMILYDGGRALVIDQKTYPTTVLLRRKTLIIRCI